MLIYCVKCHAKTETEDQKVEQAPHREGLLKISGRCVACGSKKVSFASKAKMGEQL